MAAQLRWGIIGAGIIAEKMAGALQLNPDSKLYAIASKTPEKARQFAHNHDVEKAYSYQELVADPKVDIVYIATTHNFHFENACLALKAGKHCLIEKPITVNARQAKILQEMASRKKLFLMEAMWSRFLPSLVHLKNQLNSGIIGKVRCLSFSFGGFTPPKYAKRLRDPELAGGVTLDMGIYPISIACYLLGELPAEIKSMTEMSKTGVDELSSYLFRFPSGCFATITTSFNLLMRNEALLYGMDGYISFPDFHVGTKFTVQKHNGERKVQTEKEIQTAQVENGFVYQVEEVTRCIRAGMYESTVMPVSESITIMEIMDKMRADWGFQYPFEKQ
jgi:predicted dehydrogenase